MKYGIYLGDGRKDMTAGNMDQGGALVPIQFSTDFIELLRPMAVMRDLGIPTLPTPTGSLRIPKLTSGVNAYYIGELENITKSSPTTGQLMLAYKKLAALVPMSNDLLRYSSPGADTLVRNDSARSISQREDQAFIRDDGTGAAPKGLRHWINQANVVAANGTVNVDNVTVDLGKCIERLMEANVPILRGAWLLGPRAWRYLTTVRITNGPYAFRDEMVNNGTLWGWPYRVTTQIPRNLGSGSDSEVYFFEVDNCVIGEAMTMSVDASNVAAYEDGGTVKAAFSRDETVVRVISEHDFGLRHDLAATVLTGVTWGN